MAKNWADLSLARFDVDQSLLPPAVDTKCTNEIAELGSRYHEVLIGQPEKWVRQTSMYPSNLLSTKGEQQPICCYFSRASKKNYIGRAPSMA